MGGAAPAVRPGLDASRVAPRGLRAGRGDRRPLPLDRAEGALGRVSGRRSRREEHLGARLSLAADGVCSRLRDPPGRASERPAREPRVCGGPEASADSCDVVGPRGPPSGPALGERRGPLLLESPQLDAERFAPHAARRATRRGDAVDLVACAPRRFDRDRQRRAHQHRRRDALPYAARARPCRRARLGGRGGRVYVWGVGVRRSHRDRSLPREVVRGVQRRPGERLPRPRVREAWPHRARDGDRPLPRRASAVARRPHAAARSRGGSARTTNMRRRSASRAAKKSAGCSSRTPTSSSRLAS
jgi:hypothetical protein